MAVQAQPHFPFYGSQDCGDHQLQPYYQCNSHLFHSGFDSSSAPKIANPSSVSHLQSMAAFESKQRQELDLFITLQNEKLGMLMQEQRKQQIALLMNKIGSNALPLLRKKDEEIAQAVKRTVELEEFLRRLEMENQAWQRAAQENEAMAISLNNTIEQIRENATASSFDNRAEDAESCCDAINREDEEEEEEEETEQRNRGLGMSNHSKSTEEPGKKTTVCKGCNSRESCVLFLPCRHLCSCKACEAFLDWCPVCLTGKKATIEALIV